MCDLYAGVDNQLYSRSSRSLRLQGHVTSISLENRFWDLLQQMADEESTTIPQFIGKLYSEVLERYGEVNNFASLLRVACTTFLINKTTGSISLQTA
ncbi:DNA-binding protein [Endozoicomonas sp. OPT23]|uniref:ribbon-helix-helix domain-containing protein n=1 Tax=Endozoicomonas sp. OPT23 TaxID=2072845 RepID=UPI00129BBB28|nr:ribbon-helix-helix domain-containing protein [Endozoicomonas sp. OPT23]MRI33657.1 DNA-binding protein [Endozoicomonas sp. OPT23]